MKAKLGQKKNKGQLGFIEWQVINDVPSSADLACLLLSSQISELQTMQFNVYTVVFIKLQLCSTLIIRYISWAFYFLSFFEQIAIGQNI